MQPGDQVLCVNGHNLLERSNSEAMAVLKSALAQIKPGTNSIQLVMYTRRVQNKHSNTVYVVYLAVALIWRFSESRLYHQIKCTPFRL